MWTVPSPITLSVAILGLLLAIGRQRYTAHDQVLQSQADNLHSYAERLEDYWLFHLYRCSGVKCDRQLDELIWYAKRVELAYVTMREQLEVASRLLRTRRKNVVEKIDESYRIGTGGAFASISAQLIREEALQRLDDARQAILAAAQEFEDERGRRAGLDGYRVRLWQWFGDWTGMNYYKKL